MQVFLNTDIQIVPIRRSAFPPPVGLPPGLSYLVWSITGDSWFSVPTGTRHTGLHHVSAVAEVKNSRKDARNSECSENRSATWRRMRSLPLPP
jgi:hypothetical protein